MNEDRTLSLRYLGDHLSTVQFEAALISFIADRAQELGLVSAFLIEESAHANVRIPIVKPYTLTTK